MNLRRTQGAILLWIIPFLGLLSIWVMQSSQTLQLEQKVSARLREKEWLLVQGFQALILAEQQVNALDNRLSQLAQQADWTGWYAGSAEDEHPNGWFLPNCQQYPPDHRQGLCQQQPSIWQQVVKRESQVNAILDPCGFSLRLVLFPAVQYTRCHAALQRAAIPWTQPHYLVELIDPDFQLYPEVASGRLYRITLRIWGFSPTVFDTWQSWYVAGHRQSSGQRLSYRMIAHEETSLAGI